MAPMGDDTPLKQSATAQNGHSNGHATPSAVEPQSDISQYQIGQFGPYSHKLPGIIDIKKALPSHCFHSCLVKSMSFVAKDIGICLALYLAICLCEYQSCFTLRVLFTPVYIFLQGTLMWSLFVLGHDCGHGSFSKHSFLNDVLGTVLHSLILVPYYPWKISHHHHHKNTGNMDKDEIFYPCREKYWEGDFKPLKPTFGLGLSWYAYLSQGYYPRKVSHVNPFHPLFSAHVVGCIASLGGVLAVVYFMLSFYWYTYGTMALLVHYVLPQFVFASWLVLVTFLHHTEVGVPWYSEENWDYVRGQLSSVDRHYGWAHHLTHNIGSHQIHHLFSKVPHYHLEEATAVFRDTFPDLVRISPAPILPSFMRMFKVFLSQRHVTDTVKTHTWTPLEDDGKND